MRLKLVGLFLLNLMAACHNDDSDSSAPTPPTAAPSFPTQPPPTLAPVLDSDKVAPTVVKSYQLENESTVVVEFSEPMQPNVLFSQIMKSFSWNENRTELRATLLNKSSLSPLIQFHGLRDVQGNPLAIPFLFRFDQTKPLIEGVKILDDNNLQISFNETIVLQADTKFTVNNLWEGTSLSEIKGQTLTINFPEANFADASSFHLKARNFQDLYSNSATFQSIGFSKSSDTNPPVVKSFKLVAPEKDTYFNNIAIVIEFDEYVVDPRDTEKGVLSSAGDDYSREVKINGERTFLASWKPSEDHRGAKLLINERASNLKNRENNIIEFQLTDALGNSTVAKIEMFLDSHAPELLSITKDGPYCEMASDKAFRCRVTEDDTRSAFLQPISDWPTSSYKTKTSTEVRGDETFHWVFFETYEAMPELLVSNITFSDSSGNTSTKPFTSRIFQPIAVIPEFKETIASSASFLELIFSKAIGGIDEVFVDGAKVEFSVTALDPYGNSTPKTALIQYQTPLTLGSHLIELKGVSRNGNKFAKIDSQKIEITVTNKPQVLFASFEENAVSAEMGELHFEATGLIKPEELKVFALTTTLIKSELTDIQLTDLGLTERGTYKYKIKKMTSENLRVDINRQWLTFQIAGGKMSQTAFVYWSTKEPTFKIESKNVASQLTIVPSRGIDLNTLKIELLSGDTVTQVEKSWIAPNAQDPNKFLITFPETISLTETNAILRIKSAVTTTFKIPMSKPFEILISGE
ncbi:MAG: hypothetical protein EOP10_00375 [Proteobacteria bacterium]|nr:MAG: hypothetical protein EOP10_00375 [Pseudomonadota bacterium]